MRFLLWAALGLTGTGAIAAFGFVGWQVAAFDRSMSRVYDAPLPAVQRSDNPAAIERGRHLAASLGECTTCHGPDLAGGREEPMGPLGRLVMPNVTPGARLAAYSDGELARLLRTGIKRDGTSARMMSFEQVRWWPDEDLAALISYLRAVPPVAGDPGVVEVRWFGKVLDRLGSVPFDSVRHAGPATDPPPPSPAATADYGYYLGTPCRGCHRENLAGGPIFGAPPDLPPPPNLTPHASGLADWTYEDFVRVIETASRPDGTPLNPFMPVQMLQNMDETERQALWAYLRSVAPAPTGS